MVASTVGKQLVQLRDVPLPIADICATCQYLNNIYNLLVPFRSCEGGSTTLDQEMKRPLAEACTVNAAAPTHGPPLQQRICIKHSSESQRKELQVG